jgi:hypothetical protein
MSIESLKGYPRRILTVIYSGLILAHLEVGGASASAPGIFKQDLGGESDSVSLETVDYSDAGELAPGNSEVREPVYNSQQIANALRKTKKELVRIADELTERMRMRAADEPAERTQDQAYEISVRPFGWNRDTIPTTTVELADGLHRMNIYAGEMANWCAIELPTNDAGGGSPQAAQVVYRNVEHTRNVHVGEINLAQRQVDPAISERLIRLAEITRAMELAAVLSWEGDMIDRDGLRILSQPLHLPTFEFSEGGKRISGFGLSGGEDARQLFQVVRRTAQSHSSTDLEVQRELALQGEEATLRYVVAYYGAPQTPILDVEKLRELAKTLRSLGGQYRPLDQGLMSRAACLIHNHRVYRNVRSVMHDIDNLMGRIRCAYG